MGCHVLGAKMAKCLSVYCHYYCSFPHGNPESGAINWGVCDVGRMGTWCHRSGPLGPFGSALELGVCSSQWWLKFKSFHVRAPPFWWWRGRRIPEVERRDEEKWVCNLSLGPSKSQLVSKLACGNRDFNFELTNHSPAGLPPVSIFIWKNAGGRRGISGLARAQFRKPD